MKDLSKLLEFANLSLNPDARNYEDRKLGRTTVDGVTISTAYTSDMGYETAVIDADVHPVERYETRQKAEEGHAKWVKNIVGMKQITELGYGDVVDERVVTLVRK